MSELNVQIERLEPMRMAAISVTSESPEEAAIRALLDWAHPQGLPAGAYRFFGYDNCQPHPNHTYTTWLSVGPDVKASGEVTIVDFPGGLYAATEVRGVENIGPTWKRLAAWCENSPYRIRDHHSLEEHVNVLVERPPDEIPLKLYLPVTE